MRKIELKVLSELMKNSKRSDREISKALGTSQPTVTRVRRKLENQGYIREYTAIPNFEKLEYELLAITFIKLRKELTPEQVKKAREFSLAEVEKTSHTGPFEVVMAERGIGLGYDGIFMSYHRGYSAYTKFRDWLGQFPFIERAEISSFLVNMKDKTRYMPLTLSMLARELLIDQ